MRCGPLALLLLACGGHAPPSAPGPTSELPSSLPAPSAPALAAPVTLPPPLASGVPGWLALGLLDEPEGFQQAAGASLVVDVEAGVWDAVPVGTALTAI